MSRGGTVLCVLEHERTGTCAREWFLRRRLKASRADRDEMERVLDPLSGRRGGSSTEPAPEDPTPLALLDRAFGDSYSHSSDAADEDDEERGEDAGDQARALSPR